MIRRALGFVFRAMGAVWRLIVASLLCLTPLGAVWVLGWQLRAGQRAAARAGGAGDDIRPARLIAGDDSRFGGIWQNVRLGLKATGVLLTLCLPVGGGFALSWWAGWANSFAKGYEDAWIGPSAFGFSMVVAAAIFAYLPMALAHLAQERRFTAAFDAGRILHLTSLVGLRYLILSVLVALLSFAWMLARALPVFAEQRFPALASAAASDVDQIRWIFALGTALALVVATTWIRLAVGRTYGRALALQATKNQRPARRRLRLWRLIVRVVTWAVWLVLPVTLMIGQFLNIDWLIWFNHPLVGLPWSPFP